MSVVAIHAEAVEVLVRKGRFEPEVALGVAEAMEISINLSQLVTIPVLDARLQEIRHEIRDLRAEFRTEIEKLRCELRAEMHQMKADLVRWVFLTMLGNVALSVSASAIMRLLSS